MHTVDRVFAMILLAVGSLALMAGLQWGTVGMVLLGLPQVVAGGAMLRQSLLAAPITERSAAPIHRIGSVLVQAAAVATAAVFCWISVDAIETNPPAIFIDEFQTAVRARELLVDPMPTIDLPVFYQHFAYNHFGALPLYATAPFIGVFGLETFAVRFSSVFWSTLALVILVAMTSRLGWRHGWIAVAVFALSPMALHISRLNMAHAPSFLFTAIALYAFVRARDARSLRWAVVSGFSLGLTAYGMAAWYIAAPLTFGALAMGELVAGRRDRDALRRGLVTGLAFTVSWVPIIVRILTDPSFFQRMSDKDRNEGSILSWERLGVMADNYPKYFDRRFLFEVGETGMPGGFVLRHAVPGAGTLPWVVVPLLLLGVVALIRRRGGTGAVLAVAGILMIALCPLPDISTTSVLNPPYTWAMFPLLIGLILVSGHGIDWPARALEGRSKAAWLSPMLALLIAGILVTGAVRFATGPWERYPLVSADYWGWQFGGKEIMSGFAERRDINDQLVFDPDYHFPYIHAAFYLYDEPELRSRVIHGGWAAVDLDRRQLLAVRVERFEPLMQTDEPMRRYMRVVETIHYPNGQPAVVLIDVSLENDNGAPVNW